MKLQANKQATSPPLRDIGMDMGALRNKSSSQQKKKGNQIKMKLKQ